MSLKYVAAHFSFEYTYVSIGVLFVFRWCISSQLNRHANKNYILMSLLNKSLNISGCKDFETSLLWRVACFTAHSFNNSTLNTGQVLLDGWYSSVAPELRMDVCFVY